MANPEDRFSRDTADIIIGYLNHKIISKTVRIQPTRSLAACSVISGHT